MYDSDLEGDYQDVGFSLKKIKKALKKIGGGKKKKVKKPALITSDDKGGTQQRLPLGFPVVQFSATNPETETVTVNPQKPFMPRRLIISSVTNGTGNYQVTVSSFRVGTEDMLAGSGSVPVEAFSAGAFDTMLMTRAARPGVEIALRYEVTPAVSGTDTVTVSAVLIGDAVG